MLTHDESEQVVDGESSGNLHNRRAGNQARLTSSQHRTAQHHIIQPQGHARGDLASPSTLPIGLDGKVQGRATRSGGEDGAGDVVCGFRIRWGQGDGLTGFERGERVGREGNCGMSRNVDGWVGGGAIGDERAEQRAGFAQGQGCVVSGRGTVSVAAENAGVVGGFGEEGMDEGLVGRAG